MLQYKGYLGKVEYDEDAKILHGEVVGIKDVVTFQANKASEVEKAFRDSVDDYLAFCRERNETPEKPFSGQFLVRVDKALHRKLALITQKSGRSLNTVVAECLQKQADQAMPEPRRSRRASA